MLITRNFIFCFLFFIVTNIITAQVLFKRDHFGLIVKVKDVSITTSQLTESIDGYIDTGDPSYSSMEFSELGYLLFQKTDGSMAMSQTFTYSNNQIESIKSVLEDASLSAFNEDQFITFENGKIKKVEEILARDDETKYYSIYLYDGILLKQINKYNKDGSVNSKKLFEYSGKGNLIKETTYNDKGKQEFVTTTTYTASGKIDEHIATLSLGFYLHTVTKYDNKGNELSQIAYDKNGKIINQYKYEYKYDNQGNWIMKESLLLVEKYGKQFFEPFERTERQISYF